MADISKIKLPDNSVYTIHDSNARALDNNDFDTINVTELNAGDLIVTGVGRFTNGLYGDLNGNADTATSAIKATQDESGNNIKSTYANAISISDHTITLKNKNGTSLGTVTVPDNNTTYAVSTGTANGKIKVTPSIGNAYEVSVYGLKSAAYKDVVDTYSATGTDPVSGKAVAAAIDGLPSPMVFRGSLGTGGTITDLPVDGTAKVGDTYKVITAGTYASKTAKIGDTFICLTKTSSANTWELIPSGDEPSGTVTSVAVANGGGLSVSGSPITSSGTITISHADTSSQASVNNSGRTYVQDITLDTYGHVTGITSATETVTNTDRYVNSAAFADATSADANNPVKMTLTRAGSDTASVTSYIPKVSSSSAGVAPKGAAVSSQSQSTKFLREDGTWAVPSYTTDTNTTYSLSASGESVVLTGSDSSTSTADLSSAFGAYLPLAGGQMTGTIITPKDDSMGIRPNTHNWGQVGAANYYFYKAYITNYYGTNSYVTNWASNGNIGAPSTSSAASTRGYVNFYNTCAAGGTQTKTTLYAYPDVSSNVNVLLPKTAGTLVHDGEIPTVLGTKSFGVSTNDANKKIKIKINPKNAWMLCFTVTLYQSYQATKVMISGYNYGSNHWYSQEAKILSSTINTDINVYFGYDADYELWVGFDAGGYTGVTVDSVTNGYSQISNYRDMFTISLEDSLTTIQSTIVRYRPWYKNETVDNATNATNATTASVLKTSNTAGFASDDVGNFKHQRDTASDYWNIQSNSGESKFKVYWETGNVQAIGNVTAPKFIGALQGNADTATSATTASKLGSSNVGSATQPIYLSAGTATACTHTLGKSVPSDAVFTDTKNTAGSTDTSSKIFLIGATSQAANPQTYSQDTAYVGTDGCLYSGGSKVLTAHQDISGKVSKTGDTMTGNLIVPKTKIANTCYGVSFGRTNDTPKETIFKTGIKWVSGAHMPVIHITGYAYGLQSPVEFKIGFYIYNGQVGWSGACNMGAWEPELRLFKYTRDSVDYVAVGFVGTCYFLQLQADVQDEMSKLAYVVLDDANWSWEFYTDTGHIPTPDGGTTCIGVPYKANILNGIRNVSINGNYLRVNNNGTNTDLTIPYATNANQLTKASTTLDTVDKINAFMGTLRYASVSSGIVTSTDGLVLAIPWNEKYGQQIFFNDDSYIMKHRYCNNGTWSDWKGLIDESNINDYAPTKSGTGASGTWEISISGSATSATTASKLGSSNVGSATQPIYLSAGTATACTYTLGKSVPSDAVFTDTKNTAGSTDTSSKIFLIGATSQAANPQTYSDNEVYATSGVLTTKSVQIGGGAATMQYNSTTQSLDFVFTS